MVQKSFERRVHYPPPFWIQNCKYGRKNGKKEEENKNPKVLKNEKLQITYGSIMAQLFGLF